MASSDAAISVNGKCDTSLNGSSHDEDCSNRSRVGSSNLYWMLRAGTPPTISYGAMSRVTTALAAITAPVPILTPAITIACAPIQTSWPMTVGLNIDACSACVLTP